MATFWAIVIGAIFIVAIVGIAFFGARYLRKQTPAHEGHARQAGSHAGGDDLYSSKDKEARDRREHRLNPEEGTSRSSDSGGNVHVYRH